MYQEEAHDPGIEDNFKRKFKYYKSNKEKPSLDEVSRIENSEKLQQIEISTTIQDAKTNSLGLQPCSKWQVFALEKPSGLIVIRNPFTALGQRYWITQCLEHYPRKPNKTNIDIEADIKDWWQSCFANDICDRKLQKKLRWVTMGYHHNWDTKVYSEQSKSDFPSDLSELCDTVATCLGYANFKAQAAIVNYYHMDSTLSPHTDHSEVNLEAPLFSFSFGQSAIFLIGGAAKSVEPSALMLSSGDVLVMAGDSRFSYHAVPKITKAEHHPWDIEGEIKSDCQWKPFNEYVLESRINVNVRQVLCS